MTFGDGTYVVGKTIKAGTYRASGPGASCYWERLKGFSGSYSDVIANNFTGDPSVVTIASSDKGFRTNGCGTWTSDLSPITKSKTSFGPGTYIVNTDMKPGTYRAAGGKSCYWARLSGFGGSTSEVIANGLPTGNVIVTIAATDKGFESSGCGRFTTSATPTTPTTKAKPTPTTKAARPTPTTAPKTKYVTFGDGTYVVGKTIKAGTYRAPGPGASCYWERLKGFSGSYSDVIANNFTGDPSVVTIASSDKGFRTNGCGTWTADLSPITKSKTSFGPGTYIVNTDMKPGTYRAAGGKSCYWARLSGFGGSTSEVIANGLPTGNVIVTIAATNKGFESSGCGSFTKS